MVKESSDVAEPGISSASSSLPDPTGPFCVRNKKRWTSMPDPLRASQTPDLLPPASAHGWLGRSSCDARSARRTLGEADTLLVIGVEMYRQSARLSDISRRALAGLLVPWLSRRFRRL